MKMNQRCLFTAGVVLPALASLQGAVVAGGDGLSEVVLSKSVVHPENGSTYHLITAESSIANPLGGLTWATANAYAKSLSSGQQTSSLVAINSEAEQDFLTSQFLPTDANGQTWHQVLWIGLSDRREEGTWSWENGDAIDHTNWAQNSPSDLDGNEDFVYLANTSMFEPFIPFGSWNDSKDEPAFFGALPFSAIVEVQAIPEPSSILLCLIGASVFFKRRR